MKLDPNFKPHKGNEHDFWKSVSHDYREMCILYDKKRFENMTLKDTCCFTNHKTQTELTLNEKIEALEVELEFLKNEKARLERQVLMYINKKGKDTFVFHDKSQVENLTHNGWKQITLSELLEITKSRGLVHGKPF